MNLKNSKPVDILLVEDNPADIRLTQEALKECKMVNTLNVVTDGVEAIAYLMREGEHTGASRPDLILLDLNLPLMNGQEVLAKIKESPGLKSIPVVVLTASAAEQDIVRSYDLNCNCYVTKPLDLDRFIEVVQKIEEFWFSIVKLPRE
ncbi:MAG: response regulator [Actinobacteria bacterium]|nr:response regulator [Actinomycetota bacterium]MCL5883076.1 response regulator [Actinomycetota bacterium]